MKKIITVALALAFAISASAQFGIIGGLTSSSTKLETAINEATSNQLNQYHAGIAYKFALPFGFAVQPAITYNVKGATMGDNNYNFDFKTGFIEIPVQLQWGIEITPELRPFVFAEPFVGYAISNSQSFTIGNINEIKDSWENVKNRLEYGVGAGAGVDLFQRFQVSFRYFWNLGNLYDFSWGTLSKTQETECNGILLSLGIFF